MSRRSPASSCVPSSRDRVISVIPPPPTRHTERTAPALRRGRCKVARDLCSEIQRPSLPYRPRGVSLRTVPPTTYRIRDRVRPLLQQARCRYQASPAVEVLSPLPSLPSFRLECVRSENNACLKQARRVTVFLLFFHSYVVAAVLRKQVRRLLVK